MKKLRFVRSAFTLIELLVVIAIIGILASLLLPAIARVKQARQVAAAKTEMGLFASAVAQYDADNSRMPVSATAVTRAAAGREDFTYGGSVLSLAMGPGNWVADNSEMVAILMDLEQFHNGTATLNQGHVKNRDHKRYLEAKNANDSVSAGIGDDGVYRDPWGTPYIISIDLNNDGNCRDAFYSLQSVSQTQVGSQTGFNGLFNPIDANGNGNHFEHHGPIMIWSAGPDKAIATNQSAKQGVNKDNVRSW